MTSLPSTRDPRLPYTEISDDFLAPRDPVLGYIKIGGKEAKIRFARSTGKPWVAPTRLLDPARFEVTTREKRTSTVKGKGNASGQDFTVDLGYVRDADFHALEGVGEKPSALKIRLLYPKWNQNIIAFLGAYGREWVCRGNGVEAIDIKRGECKCPCPRLIQFSGKYEGTPPNDGKQLLPCKPHAQLNVMLYDAGIFGGFWPFKTTSYETISNLIKSLRMFEEIFGRVDGLPLELRVMAATKQIPGGGTTVQPIVTLVLAASMDAARQIAADAAAESRKFLPAGRALDHETYLKAVVSEMETEAESYAGEFLQVIEETTESGGGPSVQAGEPREAGAEPEDQDETPPRDGNPNQEDGDAGDDGNESDEHKGEGAQPSDGGGGDRRGGGAPRDPSTARSDDSPDKGEREVEGGGRDRADDPEAVDDSDRNDAEQLARDVLAASPGWEPKAIDDRIRYHVKTGTLDKLLERIERANPEAWAKVAQPHEPTDGLPF